MIEISNLGDIEDYTCFMVKDEGGIGFLLYVPLCNSFIILEPDGSTLEAGSIIKNSCCLQCDAHNFDYEEKVETWKSIQCIKADDPEEQSLENQIEYILTFQDRDMVNLNICPRCYDTLLSTSEELVESNSAELTSDLI